MVHCILHLGQMDHFYNVVSQVQDQDSPQAQVGHQTHNMVGHDWAHLYKGLLVCVGYWTYVEALGHLRGQKGAFHMDSDYWRVHQNYCLNWNCFHQHYFVLKEVHLFQNLGVCRVQRVCCYFGLVDLDHRLGVHCLEVWQLGVCDC